MLFKRNYTKAALICTITITILSGIVSFNPAQDFSKVRDLDIVSNIISSLKNGDLSEEKLLKYFEDNKILLENNIEQAFYRYKGKNLSQFVADKFNDYIKNKELIISNHERFSAIRDKVIEKIAAAYSSDIPTVVLVPCIGLFSAGGWADEIDGTYHIFIALERLPKDFNMDILLTHEIAHGISEDKWEIVLDGFFREGYATYVSSVLCPGQNEEKYLYMDKELYMKCLDWIDKNRNRIYEDSDKTLKVLNDYHKFYFTTGYNKNYPNIGYVVGYEYLKYLNKKYTINELRTFGKKESPNKSEFKEFIFSFTNERK